LEAQKLDDRLVWQYALARFHYIDLKAFHNNREVWHVEPLADITGLDLGSPKYRDSTYATYHTKPADEPATK